MEEKSTTLPELSGKFIAINPVSSNYDKKNLVGLPYQFFLLKRRLLYSLREENNPAIFPKIKSIFLNTSSIFAIPKDKLLDMNELDCKYIEMETHNFNLSIFNQFKPSPRQYLESERYLMPGDLSNATNLSG